MELAEFEAPKSHIAAVSTEQKLALDEEIQGNIAQRVAGVALARRTRQSCSARVCPHLDRHADGARVQA
jgi:hypothetical protein